MDTKPSITSLFTTRTCPFSKWILQTTADNTATKFARKNWLAQFIGQTMGFRLEDNIDGISGATVSASYLIDDFESSRKDTENIAKESKTI